MNNKMWELYKTLHRLKLEEVSKEICRGFEHKIFEDRCCPRCGELCPDCEKEKNW